MSTPRFPQDFWTRLRPSRDEAASEAVSEEPRFAHLDRYFELHEAHLAPLGPSYEEEPVDPLHVDGPCRVVADWRPGLGRTPLSLFVPEHYEAKYAYPLLVWLTDDAAPQCDLGGVMEAISTRNFFGLAFPVPAPPPVDEGTAARDAFTATLLGALRDAVLDLRRRFHIHSERIFLAGFDAGAAWALQFVLQRPEWFGGAVVLGGRTDSLADALRQVGDVQGKRVLLGGNEAGAAGSVKDLMQAGRLLHSAGADVETQLFEDGQEASTAMLRHVNRWMMDGITATA